MLVLKPALVFNSLVKKTLITAENVTCISVTCRGGWHGGDFDLLWSRKLARCQRLVFDMINTINVQNIQRFFLGVENRNP